MPHCPKIHSDSQLKILFVYDNLYTVIQEKLFVKTSRCNFVSLIPSKNRILLRYSGAVNTNVILLKIGVAE